ncbi:MAG: associated Golgi protein [Rariglobus sp.]|jgi:uncharacterized membrane protein YdjX (TVP38/TMEM64 family)|nr:associated Golgi protein [Rariglobus sp.]
MRAFSSPSSKRRWLLGSLALLVLGGIVFGLIAAGFDWRAIPRALDKLNTAAVLAVTTVLPLVGFPISMVYLVIGARFGPVPGLCVVAGITALHLLGTHWVARSFLRKPLQRFVERHQHHVPEVPPGENAAIALMVMLAPAIPYFVRNYVLALSGISLRIYFGIALPIHLLRSYVALFLGNVSEDPSHRAWIFLGVFYGTKLAIFAGVAWWLRARHKRMAAERAKAGTGAATNDENILETIPPRGLGREPGERRHD